jgi:carbamoyl-phosphate synthase small subunit
MFRIMKRIPGMLALEDGRCFPGLSVGYEGVSTGEVVFNTSMTGYQEVITDMSYAGQIVAMTTPQIGNTGFNSEDHESLKPRIQGLLMREISRRASNWRSEESLDDFLKRNQIVALSEIDTRTLTKHLRDHGLLRGVIASGDWQPAELIQKAKDSPHLEDLDLVGQLSTSQIFEWTESCSWTVDSSRDLSQALKTIVVYDFGVKQNILRSLVSMGAKVFVVPAFTTAEEILKLQPDGVVFSNGPGDPARLGNVIAEMQKLIGKLPMFGICLGHQLLGRAFGATTYKMKFGHRGANQPVLNKTTGQVEITSQNHSFCINPDTLPSNVAVSHINLNDGTVEGLRHRELPIFSVQYHPEAAAGPHDATYLFEEFMFGHDVAKKRS